MGDRRARERDGKEKREESLISSVEGLLDGIQGPPEPRGLPEKRDPHLNSAVTNSFLSDRRRRKNGPGAKPKRSGTVSLGTQNQLSALHE